MTRRGKCRCGTILHFHKTSQGYKTRCPACGSVVRLRADAAEEAQRKPKNSPSAVLAASGPPPLPAEQTDFSTGDLPPETPPDLSVLSEHESTAPQALVEMPVYTDPPPPSSAARWWLLALAAVVVIAGVGA